VQQEAGQPEGLQQLFLLLKEAGQPEPVPRLEPEPGQCPPGRLVSCPEPCPELAATLLQLPQCRSYCVLALL
jgi:hypothetical protein